MARGRRLVRAAGIGLVFAFALSLNPGVAGQPPSARAASPSPPIVGPGDTRSEGEGAGLVGSPLLVALGVVLLGVGTAGLTIIYLKLRSD
jgi:hypothetical protein